MEADNLLPRGGSNDRAAYLRVRRSAQNRPQPQTVCCSSVLLIGFSEAPMNAELSHTWSSLRVRLRLFALLAVLATVFPSLTLANVGGSPDLSFNTTGTCPQVSIWLCQK